jgi:hypothetical protein
MVLGEVNCHGVVACTFAYQIVPPISFLFCLAYLLLLQMRKTGDFFWGEGGENSNVVEGGVGRGGGRGVMQFQ